jgi:hypothetical protein
MQGGDLNQQEGDERTTTRNPTAASFSRWL